MTASLAGRGEEVSMLKTRMKAFETVQPLFRAAELSTDQAAADAATCIAEMLRARIDGNLPIHVGTSMFDKLVEAFNTNVSSRKLLIEAHALTPELVKELGLERMFGDVSPCPPTDRPRTGELTVVQTGSAD
jgi:hypothetical protein